MVTRIHIQTDCSTFLEKETNNDRLDVHTSIIKLKYAPMKYVCGIQVQKYVDSVVGS